MKNGDILFVKSSEEPLVVLALEGIKDHPEAKVTVRRPMVTQNGTQYEVCEFFRFELETPEEQDRRKIEDIKRRHVLTQAAAKEADIAQFDMLASVDPRAPRN